MISECLSINEIGHLSIGGCDTVRLSEQYGTPLYVMDESTIRKNCRIYKEVIDEDYGGKGLVLYASKAFNCLEICRIIHDEGLGLDVVSEGELYTAIQANFPAKKIQFHGNNKTDREICMALEYGVGRIVVDNEYELLRLNELALEKGKVQDILFRIKPGIEAHTHEFIRTGQIDSKFGLAMQTGEAMIAIKHALALSGVNFKGLHCHIGSQIFDIEPFVRAAEVMMEFIAEIKNECGVLASELNLGGGFGIKYKSDDNVLPHGDYARAIFAAVAQRSKLLGIPEPYVFIEPGRSIVGEAGITLYTVGSVKDIIGVRTYVAVDGGMCDNPRYALYKSAYTALVANKADQPQNMQVTIAGKCCESGDIIQEGAMIQQVESGDILAVLATGAYNYSMSSNYNRILRPGVIMVKNGESRVIVKKETLDDIIKNDI